MKNLERDVTAIIVNHGTFRLTRNAIWSLHSLYPDLEILTIENGSPDDSAARLRELETGIRPLSVMINERNLHHGPGMDAGLRRIQTKWALLFDSDSLAFRRGFLEEMMHAALDGAYMVGQQLLVDESGFASDRGAPYIHPHCALVDREQYLTLDPFERHGAPCLRNSRDAASKGHVLADFPVGDYVYHIGRGTVDRHGYQLGSRSRLDRLRALVSRTIGRT